MAEIRCDIQAQVAVITIDNPAKFNAISYSMWAQLVSSFEEIEQNGALRLVIIQGEGDKAFASGADISEFDQLRDTEAQVAEYDRLAKHGLGLVRACRLPVIALIKGICMGGGMALAAMADLRYSTASANFRMPAARIGVGYDFAGVKRLAELVGTANASELFFLADSFDGKEAQRIGLVNKSFADDAFDQEAQSIVQKILRNAPLPMIAAKYAMNELVKDPDQRNMNKVEQLVQACFDSEDYKEGRTAFMEKRRPVFKGK